ncbi:MAG TPA: ABC transporter substrate-binding protein [Limnochordales bacterium]|nr:ABC transporter substrate-binding protein [Limnochordales bacterium]
MHGWALGGSWRQGMGHRRPRRVRPFGMLVALGLALGLALAGARGAWAAQGFPRTVVDELGVAIVLEEPPQRIFSAGLAMDNVLLTITDPARVVGVTRYALDPESSFVVDQVADHMIIVDRLNAEQVLAGQPDIVLVTDWNDPDVVRQLRELGVPLYTFTGFDSVEDALDMVLRIGEITGDDEAAAALVADFRRRVDQLAAAIGQRPRPRVLYLDDWWATAGPGMAYHDMIELAGGVNAAAEAGIRGWQPIDPEAVLTMNPDIIITPQGAEWVEQLRAHPVVQAVPAGRAGRIYPVDHIGIHSHHYILVIEQMARLFHPEAFAP